MKPGCRVQDQHNTNEPTAPYIIGRELNLRKLLDRQLGVEPITLRTAALDDDKDQRLYRNGHNSL